MHSLDEIGVINKWGEGNIIQIVGIAHSQTSRQDEAWHFTQNHMLFRWEFHREEDVLKITSEVLRKLLVQYLIKDFGKKKKRTKLLTRLGDGRKVPKTETNGRLVSDPQFDSIHSVLWAPCWRSRICSKTDEKFWEMKRKGCSLTYEKLQK